MSPDELKQHQFNTWLYILFGRCESQARRALQTFFRAQNKEAAILVTFSGSGHGGFVQVVKTALQNCPKLFSLHHLPANIQYHNTIVISRGTSALSSTVSPHRDKPPYHCTQVTDEAQLARVKKAVQLFPQHLLYNEETRHFLVSENMWRSQINSTCRLEILRAMVANTTQVDIQLEHRFPLQGHIPVGGQLELATAMCDWVDSVNTAT